MTKRTGDTSDVGTGRRSGKGYFDSTKYLEHRIPRESIREPRSVLQVWNVQRYHYQ